MSKHLQRDLDQLQKDMLGLVGLVEGAIHKAMKSLMGNDPDLAREVINGDDQIDQRENRIDEDCLKILALHQPVATDLRRITSAMMIVIDLERLGDLAEEIAQQSLILHELGYREVPESLEKLGELSSFLVRKSLDGFLNIDLDMARFVIKMHQQSNQQVRDLLQMIARGMEIGGEAIRPGLALDSVTRALARIADHATNIAEDVIYLGRGEIVKHRKPSGPALAK